MLLALHAALVVAPGSAYQRVWLLVHFGLFLLWQPFISTDEELQVFAVLLIFAITGITLFFLPGWLIAAWLAILIGILGGKVFTQKANERSRFYLVCAFYLFAMLLLWAVPVLLLELPALPPGVSMLAGVVVPTVLILLLVLPVSVEDEGGQQVFDFFYSLFVFQLVGALALGSVALMRLTNNDYFSALMLAVLGFALALIVLAVLWGPRTGFGGLRTYFSRYLMTVGMPFELWMRRIAELAETDLNPSGFLSSAMAETSRMPWVRGARWRSPDGDGSFGVETGNAAKFRYHDLDIEFHTEISLSPALFLHVRLLAQVVGEFYEGKRREQALRQNAYLQAVHETGAMLTHDIKNLLQTLFALTSASMMKQSGGNPAAYQALMERQLPQLAKRLQATLNKLHNPEIPEHSAAMAAADWWAEARQRHGDERIAFICDAEPVGQVPAGLFDSMLENSIENALRKPALPPGTTLKVWIELFMAGAEPALAITDSGAPVPREVAASLFVAPLSGHGGDGLGIGLFQVARQASLAGYTVSLARNQPGDVRFELTRSDTSQHRLEL
ncbi:MAG: HAMP domain-containing histidine kinase [Betaproteobacteria bacterium]|nr:HAMP domain-containing histidine kinase [Betaproteobacteria bacterium]